MFQDVKHKKREVQKRHYMQLFEFLNIWTTRFIDAILRSPRPYLTLFELYNSTFDILFIWGLFQRS